MLERVIEPRRRDLGGFEVGRVLPFSAQRMVGPFIFFDHMGPADLAAGLSRNVDVRPHPHIGLSTVTYLLDGEIMHRDSVGSEQAIRPGEVNWMTAGRGITHSERFERARRQGDCVDGLQAWVALPDGLEEIEPSFAHFDAGSLPVVEDRGLHVRVLAGDVYGAQAPVPVHSPMFYVHATLDAGAALPLPDSYAERAIYLVSGALEIDGAEHAAGRMFVIEGGRAASVRATAPSTLLVLGGEPVGRRYIDWNFVSSSKERIEQAKADWRAGRMKLPDLDDGEFIPLPPEPAPPNPMS
ncbi:pirin family protein [Cognatilysobacter bugurensis]|uniref:Pirin-like protein n=1 Tax=Cognatilysobacter bugurensis TaxID=543356 RepID=A0A918SY23_9GAMM|nr:pirin family protein [Lysobacter bugurensis]GHA73917.1 pirin-like protein [Lysobacter bugurensis]